MKMKAMAKSKENCLHEIMKMLMASMASIMAWRK
jgi:hypothetical protein